MNILEEIKFFKNYDDNLFLSVFLTLLNTPSIMFEIFPFIFLIATLFFFIEILDKNELVIYKLNGITNLNIINTLVFTTFLTGVFIILIFYNLSSTLKFFYLDIKNDYSKDDKYLAVVTSNGLWIRDQIDGNINIINAEKISGNNITSVLITQFDLDYNFKKLINAPAVNMKDNLWTIDNAYITEENQTYNASNITFKSNFNIEKIQKLFSNISALNLWQLRQLKEDYEKLGYSTIMLTIHEHRIYSYPIYLIIMVIISSILMMNVRHQKSKIYYLITGILFSVVVYYFNYLYNLLLENQKIPSMFSVWLIQLFLLTIVSLGLIKINEK